MTVVDLDQRRHPTRGGYASPAERRQAAQEHYLAATAAGEELTGDDLGRLFERSPRWGRDQIAAAAAAAATGPAGAAGEVEAERRRRPWPVVGVTVLVGLIAAGASYGHMREVALLAGEPELISWTLPFSVDGLVVAAMWARHRGAEARLWLAAAVLASMAANIASADQSAAGYVVAAWPPFALFATHRLVFD